MKEITKYVPKIAMAATLALGLTPNANALYHPNPKLGHVKQVTQSDINEMKADASKVEMPQYKLLSQTLAAANKNGTLNGNFKDALTIYKQTKSVETVGQVLGVTEPSEGTIIEGGNWFRTYPITSDQAERAFENGHKLTSLLAKQFEIYLNDWKNANDNVRAHHMQETKQAIYNAFILSTQEKDGYTPEGRSHYDFGFGELENFDQEPIGSVFLSNYSKDRVKSLENNMGKEAYDKLKALAEVNVNHVINNALNLFYSKGKVSDETINLMVSYLGGKEIQLKQVTQPTNIVYATSPKAQQMEIINPEAEENIRYGSGSNALAAEAASAAIRNAKGLTVLGNSVSGLESKLDTMSQNMGVMTNSMNEILKSYQGMNESIATVTTKVENMEKSVGKQIQGLKTDMQIQKKTVGKHIEGLKSGQQLFKSSVGKQIESLKTGQQTFASSVGKQIEGLKRNQQIQEQTVGKHIQGLKTDMQIQKKTVGKHIEGLKTDVQLQKQTVGKHIQGLKTDMQIQKKTVGKHIQGLKTDMQIQRKTVGKHIQGLKSDMQTQEQVFGKQISNMKSGMQSRIKLTNEEAKDQFWDRLENRRKIRATQDAKVETAKKKALSATERLRLLNEKHGGN